MAWEQKETDFYKWVSEGNFWFLKLLLEISDEFTSINTWINTCDSIYSFFPVICFQNEKQVRQTKKGASSFTELTGSVG